MGEGVTGEGEERRRRDRGGERGERDWGEGGKEEGGCKERSEGERKMKSSRREGEEQQEGGKRGKDENQQNITQYEIGQTRQPVLQRWRE